MKRLFAILLISVVFVSCSTVKRNGYYQTRNYNFGKHKIGSSGHKTNRETKPVDGKIYIDASGARPILIFSKPVYGSVVSAETALVMKDHKQVEHIESIPEIRDVASDTSGCDNVILVDGTEISAVVTEIGIKEIRYKRCDHQDGPTIVIEKNKVFMIEYANGKRDILGKTNDTIDEPNHSSNRGVATLGVFMMMLGAVILVFVSFVVGVIVGILGFIFLIMGVSRK